MLLSMLAAQRNSAPHGIYAPSFLARNLVRSIQLDNPAAEFLYASLNPGADSSLARQRSAVQHGAPGDGHRLQKRLHHEAAALRVAHDEIGRAHV